MKKVKPYAATPARGQALLSYQNRLAPEVQMPLYEAETLERAGGGNFLLQSDCLSACAWMRKENIRPDLVYIDPPFASGADYAKKIHLRNGGEIKNGNSALGELAMYGDIWQKEDYLNWMYERLIAIREVMSEHASIYVHLDWHVGYYVKVLMDEVFGEDNFHNGIIWNYGGRGGKATSGQFPRNHDMLLFYSKDGEPRYENVFVEHAVDIKDARHHGLLKDEEGRWFHHAPRGHYTDASVRQLESEGRIYRNSRGTIRIKYFHRSDEKYIYVKKLVGDVWDDIPDAMHTPPSERTDYPTQKPEALLKRIIQASSDEGMLVADFFSGSGTTAKVAHDLGRRFVACDIGQNAVQTSRDRLRESGAKLDVMKIKDGVRLFRNPKQTEKLLSLIPGWDSDTEGGYWDGKITDPSSDGKGEYAPVKLIPVGQRLTMQIVIAVLDAAGQADEKTAVIIYAQKDAEVSQEAVDAEAKRYQRANAKIVIKSIDELLDDKAAYLFAEDSAELKVSAKGGERRVQIQKFYSPYLQDKIREHNEKHGGKLDGKKKVIQISDTGLELVERVQFGSTGKDGAWQSAPMPEDAPPSDQKIKGDYHPVPAAATQIKIRSIAGDEITLNLDKEKTPPPQKAKR